MVIPNRITILLVFNQPNNGMIVLIKWSFHPTKQNLRLEIEKSQQILYKLQWFIYWNESFKQHIRFKGSLWLEVSWKSGVWMQVNLWCILLHILVKIFIQNHERHAFNHHPNGKKQGNPYTPSRIIKVGTNEIVRCGTTMNAINLDAPMQI